MGLFGGRYAGGCWLPLCVKSRAIVQDILTSIGAIVFIDSSMCLLFVLVMLQLGKLVLQLGSSVLMC